MMEKGSIGLLVFSSRVVRKQLTVVSFWFWVCSISFRFRYASWYVFCFFTAFRSIFWVRFLWFSRFSIRFWGVSIGRVSEGVSGEGYFGYRGKEWEVVWLLVKQGFEFQVLVGLSDCVFYLCKFNLFSFSFVFSLVFQIIYCGSFVFFGFEGQVFKLVDLVVSFFIISWRILGNLLFFGFVF